MDPLMANNVSFSSLLPENQEIVQRMKDTTNDQTRSSRGCSSRSKELSVHQRQGELIATRQIGEGTRQAGLRAGWI